MEVSFDTLAERSSSLHDIASRALSEHGHNCVLGTHDYLELVHLLADWEAYAGLLRVLLEGSQVSGNAVLGML
jgi:hypothetical protein